MVKTWILPLITYSLRSNNDRDEEDGLKAENPKKKSFAGALARTVQRPSMSDPSSAAAPQTYRTFKLFRVFCLTAERQPDFTGRFALCSSIARSRAYLVLFQRLLQLPNTWPTWCHCRPVLRRRREPVGKPTTSLALAASARLSKWRRRRTPNLITTRLRQLVAVEPNRLLWIWAPV